MTDRPENWQLLQTGTPEANQPVDLDLGRLGAYLESQGYQVESIGQNWRNAHAVLQGEKGKVFFKIGSTPLIAEGIMNEAAWNREVTAQLAGDEEFTVPKILEVGVWQGLSYYMSEHFPGRGIASPNSNKDEENLRQWLGPIAASCAFVSTLSPLDLQGDRGTSVDQKRGVSLDRARAVESLLTPVADERALSIKPLVDAVVEGLQTSEPAIAHGDFTPWQLIEDDRRLVVTDAEFATSFGMPFEDAINFYKVVYTRMFSPDTAKDFIRQYLECLPADKRAEFKATAKMRFAAAALYGFANDIHDGLPTETSEALIKDWHEDRLF
jgi:hypothetical protein